MFCIEELNFFVRWQGAFYVLWEACAEEAEEMDLMPSMWLSRMWLPSIDQGTRLDNSSIPF